MEALQALSWLQVPAGGGRLEGPEAQLVRLVVLLQLAQVLLVSSKTSMLVHRWLQVHLPAQSLVPDEV